MSDKTYNILVPNDDLDLVTRNTLEAVNRDPALNIIIAGPGENERGGIEAPAIRSKLDFKAIRFYRRLIRELGIDATFSPSTSGLATMIGATFGRRRVKHIGYRGTQAKVHRSDPANHLALLNRRVSHVICETPDIISYLTPLISASKLSGMPKPFMLSWVEGALASPKKVEGQPADALKLIYIGMAKGRPHKGLRHLVDAMTLLKDEPVALTVIGSADEADMAAAPDSVTFLGPRRDAVDFIPTHDLLMLTSTRDASPRVVREAQACGVPCVVTDIPGARDLIAPGKTGLLIEPGSPEAIAAAVRRLLANPAEREAMASRTRRYIEDNFSFDKYVGYYTELFTKTCTE